MERITLELTIIPLGQSGLNSKDVLKKLRQAQIAV
jgi:hypothetical protein